MQSLIILITCFIAALLSSMSGGGTNIIVVPVLLSLGLPLPLVIATGLVNSTFWVLPAARNYLKGRKIDWRFIAAFSIIGLGGSYLGVALVINLQKRIFEIVAGFVILILVVYIYSKKDVGLGVETVASKTREWLAYPFALVLGFYETIFGAGNGIIFTTLTFYTKGFDFISALGHYYAAAFSWAAFSAYLLIRRGYYDFRIMAVAVVGSMAGAYLGSRYARSRGNKFIKILFVAIGGVLGLKLFLGL